MSHGSRRSVAPISLDVRTFKADLAFLSTLFRECFARLFSDNLSEIKKTQQADRCA